MVWDGFIDQYILDTMGADYLDKDARASMPEAEMNANGLGQLVKEITSTPNSEPMSGPQIPLGYGPNYGPPGSGEAMFADRPTMNNNIISERSRLQMPGQGSPSQRMQANQQQAMQQQQVNNQQASIPGQPSIPRLQRPKPPSWIESRIDPVGSKYRFQQRTDDYQDQVARQERQQASQYWQKNDIANANPKQLQDMAFNAPTEAGRAMALTMLKEKMKGTKPTAGMQEYQQAVDQGYEGTFMDYKKALKGGVNITNKLGGDSNMLDPNMALKYVDKDGKHPMTKPELMAGVNSGRFTIGTADQQKNIDKKINAYRLIGQAEESLFGKDGIYSDYGQGNSLWDRMKNTAEVNVQHFMQNDPRIKAYNDFADGSISMLAKSLGEVGSLATEDVERAKKLMPKLFGPSIDTPKVANEKLRRLRKLLRASEDKSMTKKQYYDLLGEPMPEDKAVNKVIDFNDWK